MKEHDSSTYKEEKAKNEEKPFTCTGCGFPLGKYDEKCPNCERLNPNYILR
ncbi:MAG: hypothetical protein KGD64_05180 [Candidatus Heimdallarchaeota archaeon]|nr:hypothetical protein [Candidatus Heimdallarchaeota archaeon]